MSDLTARLRNTECAWRADDLHGEAADRIEALEAQLDGSLPNVAAQDLAAALAARDAVIAEAKAIHVTMAYWEGEDHSAMVDENGENRDPAGYVCLTCSGPSVEDDISNWELDLSDSAVVLWPCETVQALSRVPQGVAEPMTFNPQAFARAAGVGNPEPDDYHSTPTVADEGVLTAEPWTDPQPRVFRGRALIGGVAPWRHSWMESCASDPDCRNEPRTREQYDAEEGKK